MVPHRSTSRQTAANYEFPRSWTWEPSTFVKLDATLNADTEPSALEKKASP
jgi:hypothetical protein